MTCNALPSGLHRPTLAAFFGLAVALGSHPVLAAQETVAVEHPLPPIDGEPRAESPNAKDPREYRLAVGGGFSAGAGGWGTELGSIREVHARYAYRAVGLGASYFWLTAPNNEGNSWPTFGAQGLEGFAELHPAPTSWVDPYLRTGVLGFTHVEGIEEARRVGGEFTLGLDAVLPHFAVGLHLQFGATNQAWTMLGLHSELRF
jgi:hypothetical protein